MKITSMRLERKINLGNYESATFAAEASVEDTDVLSEAAKSLEVFVDWQVNKTVRDAKKQAFETELSSETISNTRKEKLERWLEKYASMEAEVAELG